MLAFSFLLFFLIYSRESYRVYSVYDNVFFVWPFSRIDLEVHTLDSSTFLYTIHGQKGREAIVKKTKTQHKTQQP